jgi:hypothetical protein
VKSPEFFINRFTPVFLFLFRQEKRGWKKFLLYFSLDGKIPKDQEPSVICEFDEVKI